MARDRKNTIPYLVEGVFSFYKKQRRKLPWRRKGISPYEAWVSEIMLQQTQVPRVVPYYTRFLERFPDVETLARASWEEFLPYYEGLGYYNRGRNMLIAARVVVEEYSGKFPCKVGDLERLPGVGAYTARAVASFACGAEVLAWDTNFSRVFGRYLQGSKSARVERGEVEREVVEICINSPSPRRLGTPPQLRGRSAWWGFRDFNAAVMDFGSLVCTKTPKCKDCPISSQCVYFREGGKREKIVNGNKSVFPMKKARVYVILHEDHKKYFSASHKKFQPFVLPPGRTDRQDIKDFFLLEYGLKLSVRPPKMKLYIDEQPTLIVYAQILSGNYHFSHFEPKAARDMMNTWL